MCGSWRRLPQDDIQLPRLRQGLAPGFEVG
jgi:hypothetical protein